MFTQATQEPNRKAMFIQATHKPHKKLHLYRQLINHIRSYVYVATYNCFVPEANRYRTGPLMRSPRSMDNQVHGLNG